jgi:hypothetical protein
VEEVGPRGRPTAACVGEVPGGVIAGGWSRRRLQGVFGAATELEDEQRQQLDRIG